MEYIDKIFNLDLMKHPLNWLVLLIMVVLMSHYLGHTLTLKTQIASSKIPSVANPNNF